VAQKIPPTGQNAVSQQLYEMFIPKFPDLAIFIGMLF